LAEDQVAQLLRDDLSLAAVNGPGLCVVSGTTDAIARLEQELSRREVEHTRLKISVAAHSHMLEPILDEFRAFLRAVRLSAPTMPFISNLSGTWITADEATDPEYWVRHLRQTVRFADGIRELMTDPARVYLEVGPGQ